MRIWDLEREMMSLGNSASAIAERSGDSTPEGKPLTGIRLVLADDHAVVVESLRASLENHGAEVVGVATDGAQAIELVLRTRPHVAVLDVSMGKCDGVDATREILASWPGASILVLTMHDMSGLLRAALSAGAVGVLSKSLPLKEVVSAIRNAADDPVRSRRQAIAEADVPPGDQQEILSRRQLEILEAVVAGMNVRQIGKAHGISHKTVNNHLTAIYRRLDAQNLTQAIITSTRLGLLRVGPQ